LTNISVLVSGGAGYIGSHCSKAIAEAGYRPVCYVGTGTGYSVTQILDAIRIETGEEVPHVLRERRAGDPPILVANATKAERRLRFKAKRSDLPNIIRSAWAWHQKAHPRRR